MDFQSRANSFRQGLQQQQNQFDTASANMAQFGRRYLPDKVAQHYAYMEKVGGLITGTSAGIQGAGGIAKRVQKARALRQAKMTPSAKPSETSSADRAQQLAQKTGTQKETATQRATQPAEQKAPENPFEGPSDEASDALGRAGGGKLGKANREGVFDDEPTGTEANPKTYSAKGLDDSRAGPRASKVNPEELTEAPEENPFSFFTQFPDEKPKGPGPTIDDEITPQSGGKVLNKGTDDARIGPDTTPTDAPLRPAPNRVPGTAEGDMGAGAEKDLTKGARAFENVKPTPQGTGEAITSASQDLAEAGETAMNVGKTIAKSALETVADVGMDAVPFIGEVAGLGMLIRNIVKEHKHEENAPPPQMTAPTPEATEQTGGFDAGMFKQSLSAGIV